ncbi:hypothetical protein V6N00_04100 [Tersicoccus sp. MR15.9]|uniref:hypothetical protein n=1 Tax=Tersicoccus mangrovi TaxID=3121635 RepID=UPI002FE67122
MSKRRVLGIAVLVWITLLILAGFFAHWATAWIVGMGAGLGAAWGGAANTDYAKSVDEYVASRRAKRAKKPLRGDDREPPAAGGDVQT